MPDGVTGIRRSGNIDAIELPLLMKFVFAPGARLERHVTAQRHHLALRLQGDENEILKDVFQVVLIPAKNLAGHIERDVAIVGGVQNRFFRGQLVRRHGKADLHPPAALLQLIFRQQTDDTDEGLAIDRSIGHVDGIQFRVIVIIVILI